MGWIGVWAKKGSEASASDSVAWDLLRCSLGVSDRGEDIDYGYETMIGFVGPRAG
jgi:hypothetical protein